jgi:hypothetical protein
MLFPKIPFRTFCGTSPYHSLLATSYLHNYQIWIYIQHLPQIYSFLQSEYSHISYFLFLDYVKTLTNKIKLPPSHSSTLAQQQSQIPSCYVSLDVILSSLNGLKILSSLEIETRHLIHKLNCSLLLYKDQKFHNLDSYRGTPSQPLFFLPFRSSLELS